MREDINYKIYAADPVFERGKERLKFNVPAKLVAL